jgi:hypothetical protein
MSTRSTVWLSPEVRGVSVHLYREMLDYGHLWVDVSRGYGFCFPIRRPWQWRR